MKTAMEHLEIAESILFSGRGGGAIQRAQVHINLSLALYQLELTEVLRARLIREDALLAGESPNDY
jgi:hypothetical protein